MSFKRYTEKNGICSILGWIRIWIQNLTRIRIRIKMIRIRNTG